MCSINPVFIGATANLYQYTKCNVPNITNRRERQLKELKLFTNCDLSESKPTTRMNEPKKNFAQRINVIRGKIQYS